MASSRLSLPALATYAVEQIEAGVDSAELSQKLAAFLLEERRSREYPALMRAIEAELNTRGATQVEITSAHRVTDEVKQQFAAVLDVKSPVFHETIDPSVLGGVKARSGEKQIDLTVRARLQRFKTVVQRSN